MTSDSKRSQIIRATEKLFTGKRVHEITMDEVAKAAGVGKGTLYQYFENKDELFFQTMMAGFDDLCASVRQQVQAGTSSRTQLLSVAEAVTKFFAGRRQFFRMMQAEEGRMPWCEGPLRDRFMAQRRKLVEAIAVVMRTGMTDGTLRRDIPAEALAILLMGMLRANNRMMAELSETALPCELLVELFCQGAGGRPAEGKHA